MIRRHPTGTGSTRRKVNEAGRTRHDLGKLLDVRKDDPMLGDLDETEMPKGRRFLFADRKGLAIAAHDIRGQGKRASRQLPEAGHRTKSLAARSSPIRHPLSGAIVRQPS